MYASNITTHVFKVLDYRIGQGKLLPKVWYLQADNCAKEIKNTCVMTFLCLLVQVTF
jgi:hypothetical protein